MAFRFVCERISFWQAHNNFSQPERSSPSENILAKSDARCAGREQKLLMSVFSGFLSTNNSTVARIFFLIIRKKDFFNFVISVFLFFLFRFSPGPVWRSARVHTRGAGALGDDGEAM